MSSDSYLKDLRHSCAHLLAASVLELWPGAKNAIGPAIENGFYQDFDLGGATISEADLPKIEKKMNDLLKKWDKFEIKEVAVEQAKKDFEWNPYKIELINEFSKDGKKITETKQGDFLDLCRGGHIDKPKAQIKYFKLLSVAGAYWRGDEKNKMLTRIYGTCFPTKEELEKYLWQIEESKKRDHKKLGRELDLFLFSDLVGPGLPLWTPKGTLIRDLLDSFVWELRKVRGYERVEIPHISKRHLYEKSGHWEKFKNELFRIKSREGHEFAMKPMNCPHHTQIYASRPRSYRDLPLRWANTTTCYRDEQTGELSGLSRVRAFTQDDAHVFCRQSQIKQEFLIIWDIVDEFYKVFGFDLRVRLSTHDPKNFEAYLGDKNNWREAEKDLREIAARRKSKYFEAVGEAAFYGPKIDFLAHDSLGREWQLATIQLDMNMPERFDLTCTNEKGKQERIVMIHAAIMGSLERFISILIEHFTGAFPVWMTPIQVSVVPVSNKFFIFAGRVGELFKSKSIRVEVNFDNKTLNAKIRDVTLQKVPYICIIGERETSKSDLKSPDPKKIYLSVRDRSGQDLGLISLYEFIRIIQDKIEKKL